MRGLMPLILFLTAGMCCSVFAQNPEEPSDQKEKEKPKYVPKNRIISTDYQLSNSRIEKIQALLQKYYDDRKDLENASVINDIRRDIQAFVPLVPKGKADARPLDIIKKDLQGQVDRKFSDLDKLKKAAAAEAEKKFPMVKPHEEVKVFYKRGRSIYSFKGRFYGFGLGGKSIKLNSRTISFFDLIPESKSLFDKKTNAALREAYINEKIHDYMRQRVNYSEKLFAQEYAKIRAKNEKGGYIYHNGNWITAEMVLKLNLPEKIRLYKERAEKERLEKEAREKARREAGGAEDEKKNDEEDEEEN